jgi:hypothetical protein
VEDQPLDERARSLLGAFGTKKVITDPQEAVAFLQELVEREMPRRGARSRFRCGSDDVSVGIFEMREIAVAHSGALRLVEEVERHADPAARRGTVLPDLRIAGRPRWDRRAGRWVMMPHSPGRPVVGYRTIVARFASGGVVPPPSVASHAALGEMPRASPRATDNVKDGGAHR